MPFNNTDGFVPRTFDTIKQEYKTTSQSAFPKEDFSDYENGNLYLVHYADMQNTLEVENNLVGIEESFFKFVSNTSNQIKASKIGTQNGILGALEPYVNNKQVITLNPEAGILEIYGDFIDTKENPADWNAIAKAIFESKGAGIFTQNTLGKTNTDPVPTIPSDDSINKIIPVIDSAGFITQIYFSVAIKTQMYIKIQYVPSNTDLQVLTSKEILAQSFLAGLVKQDQFGNPLYSIGKDFEGAKYLDVSEHPFASSFNIQWSLDGETWNNGVRPSVKGELLTFSEEHIYTEVLE